MNVARKKVISSLFSRLLITIKQFDCKESFGSIVPWVSLERHSRRRGGGRDSARSREEDKSRLCNDNDYGCRNTVQRRCARRHGNEYSVSSSDAFRRDWPTQEAHGGRDLAHPGGAHSGVGSLQPYPSRDAFLAARTATCDCRRGGDVHRIGRCGCLPREG